MIVKSLKYQTFARKIKEKNFCLHYISNGLKYFFTIVH